MVVWCGIRTSGYITNIEDKDVQPNGVDLRIGKLWYLREENVRKIVLPDSKGFYKLSSLKQYVAKFKNQVIIPNNVCAIFLPRSTMWRKKGLIICHSLFDTGYVGYPEVFIKPSFDVKIKSNERIGQIVFMDAEPTFEYGGQYLETLKEVV